jgi:hypothetical protein
MISQVNLQRRTMCLLRWGLGLGLRVMTIRDAKKKKKKGHSKSEQITT